MPDDIKLPEPVAYCLGAPHLADSADLYLASQYTPGGEHADEWTSLYTADQVRAAIEAGRAQRKPLTDEQVYGVVSSIGPDVMELAKQWADNEIHSYSLTHQAEVLAAEIVRRTEAAHGIPAPKGGSDA